MKIRVQLPLSDEMIGRLKSGDEVLLSGKVLTGRDAAHKRLIAMLDAGEALPVSLLGETIYYVGPAPARPGQTVGPAGPTSSYRMDRFTPPLLKLGLRGMIGKGRLGPQTLSAMKEYPAVYFAAVGGSAVLISKSFISSHVAAWPELGPEAVYCFEIEDFPAVVAVDSRGVSLYEEGPKLYRKTAL